MSVLGVAPQSDLATDFVEHTEVHVDAVQLCALGENGFGCIDVCPPFTY